MAFSVTFGAMIGVYAGMVAAVTFNAPIATPRWNGGIDVNGWTPRPTSVPGILPELFKRQLDPSFCGYLEGDPEFPVTCESSQSCRFASDLGWWGCCTGTRLADCHVATTCIESASISSCLADSSCSEETLFTACTDAASASCMQLNTVIFSKTYQHFECATARTTYEVLYTTADDASSVLPLTESSGEVEYTTSLRSRSSSKATSTIDENESSTTSTEEERSTGESVSNFSRSSAPRTTDTNNPSANGSPAVAPSSTVATGAARRTAEAVVGVVGGAAGLVALLA